MTSGSVPGPRQAGAGVEAGGKLGVTTRTQLPRLDRRESDSD
ncbi:hypothetical protein [Amycolatopsis sp. FDAARGOS 1241]|nr:hypothetical protein [Amycolatopsis sp. FDAARGOS 1241]